MKQEELRRMYGATPDSFKRRVSFAIKKTEEKPMKKISFRTVMLTAAIILALMAAAYAAFSSEVAEYFGRAYGNGMKEWLEKGDVATQVQENAFVMNGVSFTVDEIIYRDNGLYGVGTIRPASDDVMVVAEDCTPDEPFGYDIHGAGGKPEIAPEGTPTIADVARQKNAALFMVNMCPVSVGVDGGDMLTPETIGCAMIPQRDGSVRAVFELEDAHVIGQGETYTLSVEVRTLKMSLTGEIMEESEHMENFTVSVAPKPMQTSAVDSH